METCDYFPAPFPRPYPPLPKAPTLTRLWSYQGNSIHQRVCPRTSSGEMSSTRPRFPRVAAGEARGTVGVAGGGAVWRMTQAGAPKKNRAWGHNGLARVAAYYLQRSHTHKQHQSQPRPRPFSSRLPIFFQRGRLAYLYRGRSLGHRIAAAARRWLRAARRNACVRRRSRGCATAARPTSSAGRDSLGRLGRRGVARSARGARHQRIGPAGS